MGGHPIGERGQRLRPGAIVGFAAVASVVHKARLLEQKVATEESLNAIDEEALAKAQAAYDFAESSPEPAIETVYEDIWTPEDQIPEFQPSQR